MNNKYIRYLTQQDYDVMIQNNTIPQYKYSATIQYGTIVQYAKYLSYYTYSSILQYKIVLKLH